jgi:hypothetical protein
MVKSRDTAQRMVPTVKNTREMTRSCCRPKVWLMDAMTGWKMAEVRRYDVPAQKASTDDPFTCYLRQHSNEDGSIKSYHQRYEGETDHDEPLVLSGFPRVRYWYYFFALGFHIDVSICLLSWMFSCW